MKKKDQNNILKETDHITISEIDGVLLIVIKASNVNLDVAVKCVEDRLDFTEEENRLIISDIRNVISASKEAREYFASPEGLKGIKATAILTESTISKVIANFLITVNKPDVPVKVFTHRKIALAWLGLYK